MVYFSQSEVISLHIIDGIFEPQNVYMYIQYCKLIVWDILYVSIREKFTVINL